MSNAITDNALMRDVLALQSIPIGKLESIFIDLVDRGVVNKSLDCAAYARWLLGLLAGRVLIEIDPTYDSQALDHILALAIVIPLLRDDDDENLISELTDLVTSQIAINSKKYQTDTGLKASKDIDAVSIELLELVSQQIARGGESSIRLTQIAGQAKISIGSITRRYRTRDQLIDASLARDFTKLSMESATALGARLTELRNRKQLVDVINKLLSENANNPDYVKLRIQRIQILGLALSRPNLAKEITSSLHKFENAIQPGVKHLQSEDILGAQSQPLLLLTLNQIMQLGRVVVDFNHISDPNDAWLHMSQRVSQFVIDKLA